MKRNSSQALDPGRTLRGKLLHGQMPALTICAGKPGKSGGQLSGRLMGSGRSSSDHRLFPALREPYAHTGIHPSLLPILHHLMLGLLHFGHHLATSRGDHGVGG